MKTPIRKVLQQASLLQTLVRDGLEALEKTDKSFIDEEIRARFVDSLALDAALKKGNENANRWDYLLGDGTHECVIALEPHGAKDSEISVVIEKRRAALDQLRPHLRDGQKVAAWFWVQSSGHGFLDTERARRQADQAGISFVGRSLKATHLAALGDKDKRTSKKSRPQK